MSHPVASQGCDGPTIFGKVGRETASSQCRYESYEMDVRVKGVKKKALPELGRAF